MHAPLRAGLIGMGRMGRHHSRILQQLDQVDLVVACDPAGDRYRCAGATPVTTTVTDLAAYDLDYAVVAVPITEHLTVARELAANGVHALIEKPLAPTTPDAITIAQLFDCGLTAAVGYIERYNPALLAMRERLRENHLGGIYQIETRRQGPYPTHEIGSGVVFDLATHDLDIASWLTGQPITAVSAHTSTRKGHIHEDLVAVLGQLADGTITSHTVNWVSPKKERAIIVTGERGCLVADTLHGDLTFFANGSTSTAWDAVEVFRGVTEGDITRYAIPKKEPLLAEHEAFRDALLNKPTSIASAWDGARVSVAAEGILASAAAGGSLILLKDATERAAWLDVRHAHSGLGTPRSKAAFPAHHASHVIGHRSRMVVLPELVGEIAALPDVWLANARRGLRARPAIGELTLPDSGYFWQSRNHVLRRDRHARAARRGYRGVGALSAAAGPDRLGLGRGGDAGCLPVGAVLPARAVLRCARANRR